MIPESQYLLDAVLIGIGATVFIDLWALLLKRGFQIPSLNYCLLGRWLLHMPGGVLLHENIALSRPKRGECPVGWLAHYLIGVVFALVFVTLVCGEWLQRPTPLPALVFGIATTVVPLFVLQPSLGFGVASSKSPNPRRARLKSLMTHTVYGVGLYVWAVVLSRFLVQH
jgi:hypothetical protein